MRWVWGREVVLTRAGEFGRRFPDGRHEPCTAGSKRVITRIDEEKRAHIGLLQWGRRSEERCSAGSRVCEKMIAGWDRQ